MIRKRLAVLALIPLAALAVAAADDAGPARFDDKGRLLFPADYREWVFLSSGHGMSYGPAAQAGGDPPFDNVFVDRAAHAEFLKTGQWRDGAMFVLEIRGQRTHGSINKNGAFQGGAPLGIEVHLKDKKLEGGWGFYSVEPGKAAAKIPTSASCYSCHQQNAAVDTTFVQFYPTLLPVAEKAGVFSPSYLQAEAAAKK
jgi:hypothetical protein